MTIAEFIQSINAKVVKPVTKGMTKEERTAINKEYFNALHDALKVLPKPIFTLLDGKAKAFTQANGVKPYSGMSNFFTRHIQAMTGKTYKKYDGSEGIAVGITNNDLADRFADVFMGLEVNSPESNALMTLVSSHLVANGIIATRPAGIGQVAYCLPNTIAVKKSVPSTELDLE